jgi:pimeloyl-ACP methyl ester carboxylesterase
MITHIQGNDLRFDQAGTGPTFLFLHDDPTKQDALFNDCAPLAASNLRVVVALIATADSGSTQVITLLKQLGIGRAVVIAIGQANHTLIDLLEQHPDRIAAASFVADKALVRELRNRTDDPRIHALLRSGRRTSVAKAVARTRRPASAYGAVQAWSAKIVDSCRAGLRNCSGLLARLELPGLIQLDDGGDDEEIVTDAI